jgi:hypothetical protein
VQLAPKARQTERRRQSTTTKPRAFRERLITDDAITPHVAVASALTEGRSRKANRQDAKIARKKFDLNLSLLAFLARWRFLLSRFSGELGISGAGQLFFTMSTTD